MAVFGTVISCPSELVAFVLCNKSEVVTLDEFMYFFIMLFLYVTISLLPVLSFRDDSIVLMDLNFIYLIVFRLFVYYVFLVLFCFVLFS